MMVCGDSPHIQFSVFPHSKTLITHQIRLQLLPHLTSQQCFLSSLSPYLWPPPLNLPQSAVLIQQAMPSDSAN